MPYVAPEEVIAPRKHVRSVDVIYNTREAGWSLAVLDWGGDPKLGIRWNGGKGENGNPQSHARPTWFVIPDELAPVIRAWVDEQVSSRPGGLLDGYRAMAADAEREVEAQEWTEGLIGDASTPR